jgi:hypothetical protein
MDAVNIRYFFLVLEKGRAVLSRNTGWRTLDPVSHCLH